MMSSLLVVLSGAALVAGALLHAMTFMLVIAGCVYCVGRIRRSEAIAGFPGNVKARHVKLAVPAVAVLLADAVILMASHGTLNF